MSSCFLHFRASVHMMDTWRDKHHNHKQPFILLSLSFYCCHHMLWNIPLVSWDQLSWLCTFPISCLGVEWEAETSSAQCKHCSALTRTPVCYQHCFSHQSKTRHHTGCWEENELHPSQTQYTHKAAAHKAPLCLGQHFVSAVGENFSGLENATYRNRSSRIIFLKKIF